MRIDILVPQDAGNRFIMNRPYRLAYLVSHPIQYQAPLLRYISAHPKIDLTVFFLSDHSTRRHVDPGFGVFVQWDVSLLDGYKHVFLPSVGQKDRLSFWSPISYGLCRVFKTGDFDYLWVHGYAHHAIVRAIILAKCLGVKVLLRGESNLISRQRTHIKKWIKDLTFPLLLRAINGFLAIGTLNRAFYSHHGVPDEKIFSLPYAVENNFFRDGVCEARPNRELFRAKLNLKPNFPIILYTSKILRHKRPGDLLEAYIRLSPDGVQQPSSYLIYVGDGEERANLEARVNELGWSSVRFLGFMNQKELAKYYDLCDIFVLPSEHEPWGLVINEVMNAEKAVILSDRIGSGLDLVENGRNGFIVPVGDIEMLSHRLRTLTGNPDLTRQMGIYSYQKISGWDFESGLKGLLQALITLDSK